ncbi:MAG TPA: hypothetical protein VFZ28_09595 [Burkholderiaceae bacterium]|nr:hypothetical protein [Burkholderiaceae bacterium]
MKRSALSRRTALVTVLSSLSPAFGAQPRSLARATQARVGFLAAGNSEPISIRSTIEPFRQGLRELGRVEGRNLTIDFRFAEGRYERLPGLLDELLRLDPDVLLTSRALGLTLLRGVLVAADWVIE